jgi:hypothetical protein
VVTVAAWSDQIFSWTEQHNGLITALATAALALLTAILALENRSLLKASSAATEATKRAAKAAEDQATATAEALQLDWRPILTLHHTTQLSSVMPMSFPVVHVLNVGRGPALNVRYFRRLGERNAPPWQITKLFSVHGGGEAKDYKWVDTKPPPSPPDDEVWGGAFPNVKEVMICQDQAGHMYRFVDPQPIPDIWPGDSESRPFWVDWYNTLVGSN